MDLKVYNKDGNVSLQQHVPVQSIKEQVPCMWQLSAKPNCCGMYLIRQNHKMKYCYKWLEFGVMLCQSLIVSSVVDTIWVIRDLVLMTQPLFSLSCKQ